MRFPLARRLAATLLLNLITLLSARAVLQSGEVHVWTMQEIHLEATGTYANPYAEVTCWIDLKGPDFAERIHGFWDGGNTFRVRFVATAPGDWTWTTGSDQPTDTGLNSGRGNLRAVAWTDEELAANPNRRGFIRATPNGRALQYADGTPFFWLGDTWLAASTWRLPYRGVPAAPDYIPGPGISFEEAVAYRKRQGFNSVSFIAAFPHWAADHRGATYANADGIYLRNAWEKFGHWAARGEISTADGAITTAKDMHDEAGNRPFAILPDREGLADFDRINPAYFRSLDRKMQHLSQEGFVPFLETIRRDNAPAWKAYFDFNSSYARFVQYLISRYGAWNLVFSGIHLDWIPQNYSLTEHEFNAALTHHHATYGPLPFGQPYTALIDSTTYRRFGHGAEAPWLTMHTVGNKPRNHAIYAFIEEIFNLPDPYPVANLEPYYTGWNHSINRPGGETPVPGSERDIYFARAQMYGSVLSGGLAGHVHGTGAYDITTTGEPEGWRPYIWTALRFRSGEQMQHLRDFVLSIGPAYRDLQPANDALSPRTAPGATDDGLDGWSFALRTPDASHLLLYFENGAAPTTLSDLPAHTAFNWHWFNPRTGAWSSARTLQTSADGTLTTPPFPADAASPMTDWAARLDRADG